MMMTKNKVRQTGKVSCVESEWARNVTLGADDDDST